MTLQRRTARRRPDGASRPATVRRGDRCPQDRPGQAASGLEGVRMPEPKVVVWMDRDALELSTRVGRETELRAQPEASAAIRHLIDADCRVVVWGPAGSVDGADGSGLPDVETSPVLPADAAGWLVTADEERCVGSPHAPGPADDPRGARRSGPRALPSRLRSRGPRPRRRGPRDPHRGRHAGRKAGRRILTRGQGGGAEARSGPAARPGPGRSRRAARRWPVAPRPPGS